MKLSFQPVVFGFAVAAITVTGLLLPSPRDNAIAALPRATTGTTALKSLFQPQQVQVTNDDAPLTPAPVTELAAKTSPATAFHAVPVAQNSQSVETTVTSTQPPSTTSPSTTTPQKSPIVAQSHSTTTVHPPLIPTTVTPPAIPREDKPTKKDKDKDKGKGDDKPGHKKHHPGKGKNDA